MPCRSRSVPVAEKKSEDVLVPWSFRTPGVKKAWRPDARICSCSSGREMLLAWPSIFSVACHVHIHCSAGSWRHLEGWP